MHGQWLGSTEIDGMNSPLATNIIFTDGACTGNPGPGGWACIVSLHDGTVREMGGGFRETTNNRMEMSAAMNALASLDRSLVGNVILYTDSTYLIKGVTQWVWGWRARGWKTADGKDVANRDLWEELMQQIAGLKSAKVEWKYVRGHSGNPGNERCDEIAVCFATGRSVQLYTGLRDNYFIDLDRLPKEEVPSEQSKASRESSSARTRSAGQSLTTSYLSYHAGIVMRHSTWAECERRVKGQSNAKFKKSKSSQEEKEILRCWGLDPQTTIESM